MVNINMREMLEAGVHFGHQVRRWNPKMKPYIYGKKNGIYIINLQTAIELFKEGLKFITDTVASGKDVLIVGTKKQAQTIIEDISEETEGMHYVHKRWLGGLLTNFSMIKKSIEKLIDLDEMKKDGRWEVKSKKEQSKLEKVYKKLHKNLWGVRNLQEPPGVIIIIDSTYESIAVYEAKKLNIPIVAIVDTNANPEEIDFPIPGNDDAIRSIRLFVNKFGEAVKAGMEKRQTDDMVQQEQEIETAEPESEETAEVKEAAEENQTESKEKTDEKKVDTEEEPEEETKEN
jgi:small subunit ribosomal protein S2